MLERKPFLLFFVLLVSWIGFWVCFSLWVTEVKAKSDSIPLVIQKYEINNILLYKLPTRTFTASKLEISYGITNTKTYSYVVESSGITIDLNWSITSTVPLTFSGFIETYSMIETDDPENPFVRFSSTEDLKFDIRNYYQTSIPIIRHYGN